MAFCGGPLGSELRTLRDQDPQYAHTPGNFQSLYATPSISVEDEPRPAGRPQPITIPLLKESEWDANKIHDDDPPSFIHYFIEWRVTLDNKAVVRDTEEDPVLALSA